MHVPQSGAGRTASDANAPFVPVFSGETIVGRAYQMDDGTWCARMAGGTILGYHDASINAVAAILARHNAPGEWRRVNISGQVVP